MAFNKVIHQDGYRVSMAVTQPGWYHTLELPENQIHYVAVSSEPMMGHVDGELVATKPSYSAHSQNVEGYQFLGGKELTLSLTSPGNYYCIIKTDNTPLEGDVQFVRNEAEVTLPANATLFVLEGAFESQEGPHPLHSFYHTDGVEKRLTCTGNAAYVVLTRKTYF